LKEYLSGRSITKASFGWRDGKVERWQTFLFDWKEKWQDDSHHLIGDTLKCTCHKEQNA